MQRIPTIAVSAGDPAGIGAEIAVKAFSCKYSYHGTAFDIAGTGTASEIIMVEAFRIAEKYGFHFVDIRISFMTINLVINMSMPSQEMSKMKFMLYGIL